ncbi:helix-turn-helix domain-containing protein [Streptomyces sp. NPDC058256]|uniref:helix-turn-helix domain-containing protein n=1 Tax=Streptomyces sp. NPDC058256 TaxID=3346408 RepID=UPI0036ECBBF5
MPGREPEVDPVLQRRRLRERLRQLREAKELTQRDVAEALEWSLSKVIRIETGTVRVSITDFRALLQHYKVTDPAVVNELTELARAARIQPWWDKYKKDAPRGFLHSLAYETNALRIHTFEPALIPGLLQTEEYALTVLELLCPPEKATSLAELRLERQERLFRDNGPDLHFVIDENAITRIVGNPSIMRRQLEHLQEMLDHPQVTLRFMPFGAGLYRHFRTSYVIFEFENPQAETVLYLEPPEEHDSIVREGQQEWDSEISPQHYLSNFFGLEGIAKKEDAPGIIEAAIARLP